MEAGKSGITDTIWKRRCRMVQGSMDIYWENASASRESRAYRILFVPIGECGTIRHQKPLRGEKALREYLIALQDQTIAAERRQHWADQWLLDLQSSKESSLHFSRILITEQLFADFPK